MEFRHIKLGYEEALDSKKNIISLELNILNILKKIKSYRVLRNKEFIMENKIKREVSRMKSKLNVIKSTFPKEIEEFEEEKSKENNKSRRKSGKKMTLKEELESIKEKLKKIG